MTQGFDLDEIERLFAAATPGEWAVCVDATGDTFVAGMTDTAETVCEFGAAPDDDGQEQLDADAALIVALRNSLPAILTEIRELRAANARFLEALDEDGLAEIITDTLDIDWQPRWAAQAIRRAALGEPQ